DHWMQEDGSRVTVRQYGRPPEKFMWRSAAKASPPSVQLAVSSSHGFSCSIWSQVKEAEPGADPASGISSGGCPDTARAASLPCSKSCFLKMMTKKMPQARPSCMI